MNILTTEQKNQVRKIYKRKFVVVFMGAMSLVGIIFFASIVPIYLQISTQSGVLQQKIQDIQSSELASIQEIRNKTVAETNTVLGLFQDSVLSPQGYIEEIITGFEGVQITQMDVDYQDKTISFEGEAATRKDFVDMTNKLQALEWAKGIVVPVSRFAKSKDIPFSLSLIINDENDVD